MSDSSNAVVAAVAGFLGTVVVGAITWWALSGRKKNPVDPPTAQQLVDVATDETIWNLHPDKYDKLAKKYRHAFTHCSECGIPLSRYEIDAGVCEECAGASGAVLYPLTRRAGRPPEPERNCKTCGKKLESSKVSATLRPFLYRGYCSRACAGEGEYRSPVYKHEPDAYSDKRCRSCGLPLLKPGRANSSKRKFIARGFCDRNCADLLAVAEK